MDMRFKTVQEALDELKKIEPYPWENLNEWIKGARAPIELYHDTYSCHAFRVYCQEPKWPHPFSHPDRNANRWVIAHGDQLKLNLLNQEHQANIRKAHEDKELLVRFLEYIEERQAAFMKGS